MIKLGYLFTSDSVDRQVDHRIQGLSERMAKVKRFLWALNFTKSLKAEVEAEAEVEAPHSQDATG